MELIQVNCLGRIQIEGVSQKDLDICLQKIQGLQDWVRKEKIDRWAFRASLVKALNEDAEEYFRETNATFREIAAFDNGVAKAIEYKES